jgi:hypothetical protein
MVIGVRHLPRNSDKKQEDFARRSGLAIDGPEIPRAIAAVRFMRTSWAVRHLILR